MSEPKTGDQPVDEKRWPAVTALVAMPFVPRRCIQRASHCGYVEAVSIHVISGLLLVLAIIAIEAWYVGGGGYWGSFSREVAEFVQEFQDPMAWVAAGGTVLGVEAGFVLTATLLCAWGAGDEPVRTSWTRALRRLWMCSPLGFWVVVLVAAPIEALDRYFRQWDWQYRQAYYVNEMKSFIGMAGWGWVVWAVLRAIGAPASVKAVEPWQPLCEGCGYNLTMAPADSNCPECGRPVRESLAEHLRPGTPWQRRRAIGRIAALLQTWRLALTRPRQLGAQMQVRTQASDHRWYFAIHLALFFAFYFTGAMAATSYTRYFVYGDTVHFESFWRYQVFSGGMSGLAFMYLIAIALPAAATLSGFAASLTTRRNLLHAAAQAGAYLSIYPVIWAMVNWGLGLGTVVLDHTAALERIARTLHVERWQFLLVVWVATQITLLVGYFALMRRIVMATRYANR